MKKTVAPEDYVKMFTRFQLYISSLNKKDQPEAYARAFGVSMSKISRLPYRKELSKNIRKWCAADNAQTYTKKPKNYMTDPIKALVKMSNAFETTNLNPKIKKLKVVA